MHWSMHKEQERLNVLRLLPRWTQSRAGEIEHPALVAEMNKEYKAPYLKKLVYYLLDYLQIKWQKKKELQWLIEMKPLR